MPQRTAPTARQQRLGHELRRLRERADLSATQAGQLLGIGQARVSNTEAGRIPISSERVRKLAYSYSCSDSELIDALANMTTGRTRHWWEKYRETLPVGLLDLAELEHHASAIRTAQVTHLPGILQTADYARTVFQQSVPGLPTHEVEQRVSHRIKRQDILYRDQPTRFTAVIHEAALRMQFGGADVTREQLRHLMSTSERSSIHIFVLPFSAGIFPGAGQTVVYAEGPVPQLDTVQLDAEHGFVLVHSPAALENYRTVLDRMESMALNPSESRDFIESVIKNM